MNKMLFVAVLAISLGTLSGCNKQTTKTETAAKAEAPVAAAAGSDQQAYEASLAAAKAEIKKAKAVSGEWRDTGKILKKAEQAAVDGDYGTATKLSEKAKFQAIRGQEQAAAEANAGNPAYLY